MKQLLLSKHLLLSAFVCSALFACGGEEPPPQAPAEPVHEQPHASKPSLNMKSELGTVDPHAVAQAFTKLDDKFMACQKQALDRVEVLAGGVKFFLRIGENGSARWVRLEASDVGDEATEKCLIDTVMGAKWPKPDGGGDAEARYSMELPQQATRPPNDWDADKIANTLGKNGGDIDKCKSGSSGSFHATMYVGPGGKVLAAGVLTSSKADDDKVECLVKVLEGMKGLPSPGSWPAKVSFGL